MLKKISKLYLTYYIILNILIINISNFLVIKHVISYFLYSRFLLYLLIGNIIVIIINLIQKRKTNKLNYYDIIVILLIVFAIISTIFSIYQTVALYGYKFRFEGLSSVLYYITIFYLSSYIDDKKDKKKIAYTIIITGVIQAVYGFLQMSKSPLVETIYHNGIVWAIGFTENPNFFGTYMLMSLLYTYGLLLEEKKKEIKLILGLLSIILLIGLYISNTLSCVVGLLIAFILIVIYSLKYKKKKELLFISLSIPIMLFLTSQVEYTTLVSDIIKTKDETVEITKGDLNNSYGTRRVWIWKESLKIAPKYFLTGAGLDNFPYAFEGGPLISKYGIIDKAHNELLQILITEGLFCLLTYIVLYATTFIKGLKNLFKKKEILVLLPVIGYLVQAQFNISSIEVAPIFYISLGLLIERNKSNKKKS